VIDAAEDAIHAWVVVGSGLAADRVYWVGQGGALPPRPFITLQLRSEVQTATDWLDTELTPGLPQGAELTHTVHGGRLGQLSIQCFATAATGNQSPARILAAVVAAVALPSVDQALNAAGVGVGIIGPQTMVPDVDIDQATPRPRANVDVSLNLTKVGPTETGTRIDVVGIATI
jgi:hypothetical protein